jgi:hypothetical protein
MCTHSGANPLHKTFPPTQPGTLIGPDYNAPNPHTCTHSIANPLHKTFPPTLPRTIIV